MDWDSDPHGRLSKLCSQLLSAAGDAQESACGAGVDGSERIAGVAKRLVAANNLAAEQGGPISVVQGRLEQLAKLPVEKVRCPTTLHVLFHAIAVVFDETLKQCFWSSAHIMQLTQANRVILFMSCQQVAVSSQVSRVATADFL